MGNGNFFPGTCTRIRRPRNQIDVPIIRNRNILIAIKETLPPLTEYVFLSWIIYIREKTHVVSSSNKEKENTNQSVFSSRYLTHKRYHTLFRIWVLKKTKTDYLIRFITFFECAWLIVHRYNAIWQRSLV